MLLETAFSKDPTTGEWLKKVVEFDSYRGSREFESILSTVTGGTRD